MRTTGATDDQIEAAAKRLRDEHRSGNDGFQWNDLSQSMKRQWMDIEAKPASRLVTTDHRIVRVDDLRALVHAWLTEGRLPTETYDRIQAAIGEDE